MELDLFERNGQLVHMRLGRLSQESAGRAVQKTVDLGLLATPLALGLYLLRFKNGQLRLGFESILLGRLADCVAGFNDT